MLNILQRLIILGLSAGLLACIPTAARKNAKLKPGASLEVLGGVQTLGDGIKNNGETSESKTTAHFEADIQWATIFDGGSGLAFQVKVPWSIVYSSLDIYYQLASLNERTYFGFGLELGGFYGGYAAATHYIERDLFITFTPRLLRVSATEYEDGTVRTPGSFQYSGQLAVGFGEQTNLSVFAMVAHQTGQGFDIAIDLFGQSPTDYRTNYGLLGVSVRR